jgi:acid phosphatase type 7
MSLETHRPRQPGSPLARVELRRPAQFEPIPFPPKGSPPYHLQLGDIVRPEVIQAINAARRMVFHAAGDTGGVKRPEVQALVARGMEQDYAAASEKPAFFYHLATWFITTDWYVIISRNSTSLTNIIPTP